MTADLSALIARLEAAEAGSRELDYAIKAWLEPIDDYWAIRVAADWTTSLDAALALAERPGMDGWRIMYAALMNWKAHDPRGPLLQTLPLALCIATLRAKLDGYEAEGEVNKNPNAQEG